jgi:hypothetical protein
MNQPLRADLQTVTEVRHWSDRLFSFRVTRPASLRFRSGEFVMIGLPDEAGKPILRAYSIASPAWDDGLEFYSIKVPDGPLTSRLQHVQPGWCMTRCCRVNGCGCWPPAPALPPLPACCVNPKPGRNTSPSS